MLDWKKPAEIATVCAATALLMGGCKGVVDDQANATFMQKLGRTSFTVFPAVKRSNALSYDHDAAAQIAAFLTGAQLGEVTVAAAEVPLDGGWHHNQARMLAESAASFAAYLKEHPVETEYALLAEYLFGRSEVGGIHCYILDAEGRVADAVLLNSHHRPFADAQPKTVADCNTVLIKVLREELESAQADQ